MPKNRIHTLSDGRYAYSGTDAAGKRHSIKSRQGESKRAFAKRCDQLDQTCAGEVTITTMDQLFNKWSTLHLSVKCSAGDQRATRQLYRLHVKPIIGHRALSDLTRADIFNLLTIAEKKQLSASTLSKIRGCISRPFNWAINTLGLSLTPPTAGLRYAYLRPDRDKRRRYLTEDETDRILAASNRSKYGAAFELMLELGLRPSEVLGIQARDIQGGFLSVRRGVSQYGLTQLKTSTARRDVPLTKRAKTILNRLKKSTAFRSSAGWLFYCEGAPDGLPSADRLKKELQRTIRKVNKRSESDEISLSVSIIKASPYDFRHTFATRMAERGMPAETLRAIMGHADVKTTLTYYVDVTPKMLDAARAIMDA